MNTQKIKLLELETQAKKVMAGQMKVDDCHYLVTGYMSRLRVSPIYPEAAARNVAATYSDVIDNRTNQAQKADYYLVCTNGRESELAVKVLDFLFNKYGIEGLKKLWKQGLQDPRNIEGVYAQLGRSANKFAEYLKLQ